MLRKIFFNQQFIRTITNPSQSSTLTFTSNPRSSFSVIQSNTDESILPPEERPNYYNVYDDDEIFEPEFERESQIEVQNHPHHEDQSEVFNSTFDDEVF